MKPSQKKTEEKKLKNFIDVMTKVSKAFSEFGISGREFHQKMISYWKYRRYNEKHTN